jgi:hypothetical protein
MNDNIENRVQGIHKTVNNNGSALPYHLDSNGKKIYYTTTKNGKGFIFRDDEKKSIDPSWFGDDYKKPIRYNEYLQISEKYL